ncbi:MAG: DUF4292 domain-containing protein, partial [Muribaculaceae bacterium]|nr:DUF4292 domain-containing protein [Muribaculaceae bacterium]
YISLRMLGMEVAYVYADTDSLYAVDKFHRRYFSADISSLSSRYGMTLGNLQNFMLGRIFTFTEGGNAIPDARNVVFQEREICLLEPESDGLFKSIFIAGTAADNMPALISFAVEVSETRGLTCHYGTPVRTAHGTVVTDITLQAVADDINGSAHIEWTPDEAKWDDRASSVKFRRPSGYVRVSAEQILAMLGKK